MHSMVLGYQARLRRRIKTGAGGLAQWKSLLEVGRGDEGEKFSRSYNDAHLGALPRGEFLTNRNGGARRFF
jgi:hypothetical protein